MADADQCLSIMDALVVAWPGGIARVKHDCRVTAADQLAAGATQQFIASKVIQRDQ